MSSKSSTRRWGSTSGRSALRTWSPCSGSRTRRRAPRSSSGVRRGGTRCAGAPPPARLREAATGRVVVTGRVPDLIPYVERAAVVAAPIRFGGGMRVKVLEALAAGKPVVASSLAVEGLGVSDGDQLLIAET